MGKDGCQLVSGRDVDVEVDRAVEVAVGLLVDVAPELVVEAAVGLGVDVALTGFTSSCGERLATSREARLTRVELEVVRTKLNVPWVLT